MCAHITMMNAYTHALTRIVTGTKTPGLVIGTAHCCSCNRVALIRRRYRSCARMTKLRVPTPMASDSSITLVVGSKRRRMSSCYGVFLMTMWAQSTTTTAT